MIGTASRSSPSRAGKPRTSREIDAGDFVILIMDQAGWHKARALQVPERMVILYLPPYAPELNPVENLWGYMQSHSLSNRAYEDYDHIQREIGKAYRSLTPSVLRAVCRCDSTERES